MKIILYKNIKLIVYNKYIKKAFHVFLMYLFVFVDCLRLFFKKNIFYRKLKFIAVVRTENIGDIIASEPLSRHIHAENGGSCLVWFVKKKYSEILYSNPYVNEVVNEFCPFHTKTILKILRFDNTHIIQFGESNFCKLCDELHKDNLSQNGISNNNYFNYGNLLTSFSIAGNISSPLDVQPMIYPFRKNIIKVNKLSLPSIFIVVHCKSSIVDKDWSTEKWEKLILLLTERFSIHIVEIGLESDFKITNELYINLTGKLSIIETAEVIKRAKYFIGLDSGPSHMANAVGTFGFILMGSLGPYPSYNPYSGNYGSCDNCIIIRSVGHPCRFLTLHQVKTVIFNNII